MLVCPLCRLALGAHDAVCPRDGNLGQEASWNVVPAALEKRFTLIAPFAHGLTGSTYVADEPETGRRGLLKVIAPAARTQAAERQRMRRELLKQSTMAASNLALPFATGETEGVLWLFREHVEGIALHSHLKRNGPLPMSEALLVAAQLTSGLDELHRAGLLHRDVKPSHIILSKDETGATRAVLIESGVCRPLEGARTSGMIFGTAGYVAPEQLAGKLVSFRSDLYALGCVLYEMLTASAPFARNDTSSTLAAQQEGALPPFPAELSPQVAALVASLLAKDPQDRPFSAQKLRRTLDPFLPYGATVNRHPNASLNKPPADKAPSTAPQVAPISPSRIPGIPSAPPPRPMGRSSVPPPPPTRRSNPDATQQLQVEQMVEMVAAPRSLPPARPASIAPPPTPQRSAASEAARKRDATEPVELDSVLDVRDSKDTTISNDKTLTKDRTLSNEKTIERPATPRPSADMTQPIRLDQILGVAEQRKKALSAPPPASVSTPAPAPAAPVGLTMGEDEAPPSIELKIPDEPAENPFSAVLDQPVEASPHTVPPAALPVPAPTATPVVSKRARAATLAYDLASDPDEDELSPDAPTVVAERPNADQRSGYATLVGMPMVAAPPVSGTNVRGSEAPPPHQPYQAVETPQQVVFQQPATDSAQLTLPRDPVAAMEEARRMDARHTKRTAGTARPRSSDQTDDQDIVLPMGSAKNRKIGYAAAAVVLLGLLGLGAAQLFGDDEKAVAKQDQGSQEPKAASADTKSAPPEAAPAARPLAEAPKAEPTPTVTRIEVVQPAAQAPAAAPVPVAVAEPEKEPAKPATTSSRSERSSRRERAREAASEKGGDKVNKEELWSAARDEARAHYAAKRYKQAAQAYEQAAKYNPSHAGTFAGLGGARLQSGDNRGAIQAYQRAVTLSPDTSGFHAALGKAYLTAGDKSKARASYKRALALDPKNEAAKNALLTL